MLKVLPSLCGLHPHMQVAERTLLPDLRELLSQHEAYAIVHCSTSRHSLH